MTRRVLRWLWAAMPPASAVLSALALGYQGLVGNRMPMQEVGKRIGPIEVKADAAQSSSHHAASMVDEHTEQLKAAWAEVVALHAAQKVYRMYGSKDAARRNELIDDATDFYRARYAEQIDKYPTRPAEAARIALLQTWKPSR